MRRPPLPCLPPPATGEEETPGFLVVRTAHDDQDAWRDTLSHLADLPGVCPSPSLPRPGGEGDGTVPAREDRRLVLVNDPAWRDATTAEVRSALEQAGPWRPDLVLLADGRTMADPVHRPLLAFTFSPGYDDGLREGPFVPHERVLRIGARQAAMLHLVFDSCHRDLSGYKTDLPGDPARVFGAELDLLSAPPRHRPLAGSPARLPVSGDPLVVRTHHGDDGAWEAVMEAVRAPVSSRGAELSPNGPDAFYAYVHAVDDTAYTGLAFEQLMALTPRDSHPFLMVADELTMSDPRHPLLVVDLGELPGSSFRAAPGAIQAIENNLSVSNMAFEDFDCGEGLIQYWEVEHEPGTEVL